MRKIKRIIRISGSAGVWDDGYGKKAPDPEIAIGMHTVLAFDLRKDAFDTLSGELLPVDIEEYQCSGYYIALDGDYDHATDPKLLKNTGIILSTESSGSVVLSAEIPNTALPGLVAAVGTSGSVTLKGEIGGFNAENDASCADFVIQFSMRIVNRVYMGEIVGADIRNDPEYLTAAQVRALCADAVRGPAGPANTLSIGTVSDGEIANAQLQGVAPNQTLSLVIPRGKDLKFEDLTDSQKAELRFDFEDLTDAQKLLLKGDRGAPLKFDDLTDAEKNQLKGKDGAGLDYDVSGEASELHAYDDEAEGFRFAASVADEESKTSTLYIWTKKSASTADWSDPLEIKVFEHKVIQMLSAMGPSVFTKSTNSAHLLKFDLSKYPNAFLQAVTIDTPGGEELLPFGRDSGIVKVEKTATNVMNITFGYSVPEFETGKVYFSQFYGSQIIDMEDPVGSAVIISGTSDLELSCIEKTAFTHRFDAVASDGSQIVYTLTEGVLPEGMTLSGERISGTPVSPSMVQLTIVASGGGSELAIHVRLTVSEAPPDIWYGRVNDGTTWQVSSITSTDRLTCVHSAGEYEIQTVPGSVSVILVPAGYTVWKDDGFGGKIPFDTNNGAQNSGANHATVVINGKDYFASGEFNLVTSTMIIYIEKE